MIITCALRDLLRAQRSASIVEFVGTWVILPFSERGVELDIPVDMLASGDRLLDPAYDREPIALCRRLSRGEAIGQNPRHAMPLRAAGAAIANGVAD